MLHYGVANAQTSGGVTLSWADLEAGCEASQLAPVAMEECRLQLDEWRSDYFTPQQQPDLLAPRLDQILAELPEEVAPNLTLWDRVWAWLKELLGGGSAETPNWMRDWKLPQNFADWLIGLSVGACVLLALGIVGNELVQVYRGRALAHVPGSSKGAVGSIFAAKPPSLADVSGFPLQEQPGILLQVVLSHLQQRSLLPRQVGRTHQNLLEQSPQLGALGEPLAAIALAAERSTYGDWQVSHTDVAPLLTAGEQLLAKPGAGDPNDER